MDTSASPSFGQKKHRLVLRNKNSPCTEDFFCQGRISKCYAKSAVPPCFTGSVRKQHAVPSSDANTSLASDAGNTLRNTAGKSLFLRTLSGPFDIVFRTRIPASRALCGGIGAVISASTVWTFNELNSIIITCHGIFVNRIAVISRKFFTKFSGYLRGGKKCGILIKKQ